MEQVKRIGRFDRDVSTIKDTSVSHLRVDSSDNISAWGNLKYLARADGINFDLAGTRETEIEIQRWPMSCIDCLHNGFERNPLFNCLRYYDLAIEPGRQNHTRDVRENQHRQTSTAQIIHGRVDMK